jgi:hypothetical protein
MKRKNPLRRNHKYNAKACRESLKLSPFPEMAGRRFDSQLERAVGYDLCVRLHAGEISDLKFQDRVYCDPKKVVSWKVDFSYVENGSLWYHEAKGFPDEIYKMKLKLFLVYGKHPLKITEGSTSTRRTTVYYPSCYLSSNTEVSGGRSTSAGLTGSQEDRT